MKIMYPDRELIRRLHARFLAKGIDSLTRQEVLDLINHQHEYLTDLEKLSKVQHAD